MPQLRNRERYHILGEHGRGGLGKVSRAHDLELGRDVAIKELLSRSTMHEMRFMREALITARLEHPSIVPVHEAGRWPDGTPFYAMKLVAGRPLGALLADRKTIDERLALLDHVIAVADAIAYAHDRNIIHRDLKPNNVIVGAFGETVVIDWGLAKDLYATDEPALGGTAAGSIQEGLTSAGAVLGTPAYMAPEQQRGESVDQRADVYAIGAMLWELCSFEKPPVTYDHQHRRMLRRAGIDPDLIAIIEKTLATNPEHRYRNASLLTTDLKAFKTGERIRARHYSPGAAIAHWVRRHRLFAASIVSAIVLAITASIAYVHAVTTERNRTRAALETADRQRRQALIATATALLARDPTQAWSGLEALGDDAQDAAVIRARIEAAGLAEVRILLPGSMDHIVPTPGRTQLIVALQEDRSLYVIDAKTGKLRQLAKNIALPSKFAATDSHVYVVRSVGRLVFSKIEINSGISEDICELKQLPDDLMVGGVGLFWQNPDGILFWLAGPQNAQIVASNVAQFSIAGDGLIICRKSHQLYATSPKGKWALERALGSCKQTWRWAERNGDVAIFKDDQTILTYHHASTQHDDSYREISFHNDNIHSYIAISPTGLLAAVDVQGNGAFLRPYASNFEHISLRQQPVGTTTGQDRIAWTFQNGEVSILDSITHQEWTIKAHATRPWCMFFISDKRLLTCESKELRFWAISASTPRVAAVLPSSAFHIVANNTGEKAIETENGEVYLASNDLTSVTLLHTHSKLAWGVAWCDQKACSASWDGNIICRSLRSASSEVVASFGVPIRAFFSDSGHCYAAVSNGGIYDIRASEHPIYRHQDEPHRLTISRDRSQIVSADWGGSIKTWSTSGDHAIHSVDQLHGGRITYVNWTDDGEIVTAGLDGNLYLLSSNLTIIRRWRFSAGISYAALDHHSLYFSLHDGTIRRLSISDGTQDFISLGTSIRSFAASDSQKYIAAGSEEGDLFIIDDHWRVAAKRLDGGAVQCVVFENATNLLACTHDGRIFRIDVATLPFSKTRRSE